MEKSQPAPEFAPSDKEVPLHREVFYTEQKKAEKTKEETTTEKLKRELSELEREAGSATGEVREEIQKDIDAIRNELGQKEETPKEQTGKTVDEATKNARIDEIKAEIQQEEIKKEFEALPEADKEKVKLGLQNVGFYVEENKNRFFAKLFQGTRMAGIASGMLKEKGSLDRFLGALGENAEKDAELSRKRFEDAERTSLTQVASIGATIGNIAKYGRIIGDIAGWTAAAPLRYAMMGSMLFGTGSGAVKEARFKNEEVLEKTRLQDINTAAEEAWKIYEQAEAEKETVSKEDLVKAYQASVPKDLLARLQKDPEPGTASGILQGFIKSRVESSVKKINGKIEEIEQDKNLSEIDKKVKQEKILNKYSKHLNDLDRAVSRFGTVDALALGAKYTETGAKHAVTALTVETLAFSIYKLWENLPSIMETANEYLGEQFTTEGSDMPTEYQEGKRFPMGERPVEVIAPAPAKLGEIEESLIVQKGEGVSDALLRQLSDDPEKFGFAGDSKDDGAVTEWARSEVKNIVTGGGYWNQKTSDGVGVSGKGGDAAYEMEKGLDGHLKINTYLKNDAGNFVKTETREVLKDFESAQLKANMGPREYMRYGEQKEPIAAPVTVIETPTKEALIVPEPSGGEVTAEYQPPVYDTPKSTLGSDTLERGEVYAEGVEEPTQKYTYNMPKGLDYDQAFSVAEKQTHNEISAILGSKGFLGFGVKDGMTSPDWTDRQVGFANATVENVMFPETHTYGGDKDFGIKDHGALKEMQKLLTERFKETGIREKPGEEMGKYLTRTLAEKMSKGNTLLTEVPIEPANIQEPEKGLPEERQKTDAEIKRDLKAWAREFD